MERLQPILLVGENFPLSVSKGFAIIKTKLSKIKIGLSKPTTARTFTHRNIRGSIFINSIVGKVLNSHKNNDLKLFKYFKMD